MDACLVAAQASNNHAELAIANGFGLSFRASTLYFECLCGFLVCFSSEVATESPHGTKNAKNSHIFERFAARNNRIVGLISVRLPSCHRLGPTHWKAHLNLPEADPRLWRGLNKLLTIR